jgi:hypothetical protein
MTNVPPASALRAAALRLSMYLSFLQIGLALLLVTERLGYAGAYGAGLQPVELARQLLFASPAIAYLVALWRLSEALGKIGKGTPFNAAAARALRRVGLSLVGGAILTLLMPWVHLLAGGASYPRLIDFDVATLVIGAIGLALIFLARLVEHAGVVQAELDEMF